jgi:putative hydrolase of the HAD superfamily
VLIIGDDPQSEIKAAQDFGIEAVLYDRDNLYPGPVRVKRVNNFHELKELIK